MGGLGGRAAVHVFLNSAAPRRMPETSKILHVPKYPKL